MEKKFNKYWYLDQKGNLGIDRNKFINHLTNDIGLYYYNQSNTKQLIRIENNIIYPIDDVSDIANLLFNYLDNKFNSDLGESIQKDRLKNYLISKSISLLNKTVLGFIPIKELNIHL